MIIKGTFFALLMGILLILPPFLDLGWQNAMVTTLIAVLFAMAFNLLMGQAGMLSFGHAAYFGIGTFAVLHLMEAVEDFGLPFPTPLLPIAGAAAGFGLGLIVGYFSTKRAGVYFSLVTLALAELLHSLAPHWEGIFGGEAGLSTFRMPWAGFTFGSTLEVYYVVLAWVAVSLLCLWFYTRTAFGRVTLALRDNEERLRFMGFKTHQAKTLIFAISAMFSGIAGGLLALSNEIGNYTLFATSVSAQVVLTTFIGGSAVFLGPAVGAVVLTLFSFLVSDLTRSWLLYQGLIFVLVMLYAPFGLGGLVQLHIENGHRLSLRRVAPGYVLAGLAAFSLGAALIFVVEICSIFFSPEYATHGDGISLWGQVWAPEMLMTWGVPLVLAVVGSIALIYARRLISVAWASPEPLTGR